MNYLDIATPFIDLGIKVFPLPVGQKAPIAGMSFLTEATTDPAKIKKWNTDDPNYNVGILADDNWCFLEFDIKKGMRLATEEMGNQPAPTTRIQRSGGGFGHYIFAQTDRSCRPQPWSQRRERRWKRSPIPILIHPP